MPSEAEKPQPLEIRGTHLTGADLRALLIEVGPTEVSELRVVDSRIRGPVDLRGVGVAVPLSFQGCAFDGGLAAGKARFEALRFSDCRLAGLDAQDMTCARALGLTKTLIAGDLVLAHASVKGRLDAEEIAVDGDASCAELSASSASFAGGRVAGALSLDGCHLYDLDLKGVEAARISLVGANVRGRATLDGARVGEFADGWPKTVYRRSIKDFAYQTLTPLGDITERLRWLEEARGVGLDSYERLADALRAADRDRDAERVLIRGGRRGESGYEQRLVHATSEALRTQSPRRRGTDDLRALAPSLAVFLGASAAGYGAGAGLPNLTNLTGSSTEGKHALIAWFGLAITLLVSIYAALPLSRWVLTHVAPKGRLLATPASLLAATVNRIDRRYGLDARYAWARLAPLLPAEERAVVEDTQRRLDAATAGPGAYVGAALAGGLFAGLFDTIPALIVAPAAMLVLAAMSLSRARAAARAHGKAIEAAVDLHRFRLLHALHLPLPDDPARERTLFEQVSWSFMRAEPSAIDYVHPVYAQAELAAVGDELEKLVSDRFAAAIGGPRLVNFDGHVSVRVLDPRTQEPVVLRDGRTLRLEPGYDYLLEVTIADYELPGALTEPVRIVNGDQAEEVPFDVGVDADSPELRSPETQRSVPLHGLSAPWRLPLRLRTATASDVYVRVSQHGRLQQVVTLRVTGAEP